MAKKYLSLMALVFIINTIAVTAIAAMSNTSLNGEYVAVGYYGDAGSGNGDETYMFETIFDGAGGISVTDNSGTPTATGSYSLEADGSLTITVDDLDDHEISVFYGITGSDGNIVSMVDTDYSVDGDVNLIVMTKKSDGMSPKKANPGLHSIISLLLEE